MKIDSKVLAVALERIGSVLSLQKFVTNEDYRRVRFVVKDDELVLTATDGYLIAKIWICPIRCADKKCDPKFVAAHEIAHAFLNCHNDEVRTNIVASLL